MVGDAVLLNRGLGLIAQGIVVSAVAKQRNGRQGGRHDGHGHCHAPVEWIVGSVFLMLDMFEMFVGALHRHLLREMGSRSGWGILPVNPSNAQREIQPIIRPCSYR